jgi:predicted DNA-binding antitoxin AbrB/MazE fold protein
MQGLEIDAVYERGTLKLPRELPLVEGAAVRITIHPPGQPGVVKHLRTPWAGTQEELERLALDPELLPERTERCDTEFQRQLAEAQAEIPRLMEAARRDAQNLTEGMLNKARQEIQAERQRMRREIETARKQALKDIRDALPPPDRPGG